MENSSISNTQSDAFDGDFVTGEINSCEFENLGNDAIDVSGSDITILNVRISNAGDKGISAGENSRLQVRGTSISESSIGIAGKDLSIVLLDTISIENTKLGFTAYQKKSEFGPSRIIAKSVEMKGVETDYLIENTSTLIIGNDTIMTKQDDVKSKMYGVEFGVSTKK